MTGKFKDKNNSAVTVVMLVTFFLGMPILLAMCFLLGYDNEFVGIAVGLILSIIMILEMNILSKGSYFVCKNEVVFHIRCIKYTFDYSEIRSAETQVGFTRSRYGFRPHVELSITLNNGETVTFRDDVQADALITPEKHREFLDNHQFTKLSSYINQRAGNFGSVQEGDV